MVGFVDLVEELARLDATGIILFPSLGASPFKADILRTTLIFGVCNLAALLEVGCVPYCFERGNGGEGDGEGV